MCYFCLLCSPTTKENLLEQSAIVEEVKIDALKSIDRSLLRVDLVEMKIVKD
jgi:hypothetical protein